MTTLTAPEPRSIDQRFFGSIMGSTVLLMNLEMFYTSSNLCVNLSLKVTEEGANISKLLVFVWWQLMYMATAHHLNTTPTWPTLSLQRPFIHYGLPL